MLPALKCTRPCLCPSVGVVRVPENMGNDKWPLGRAADEQTTLIAIKRKVEGPRRQQRKTRGWKQVWSSDRCGGGKQEERFGGPGTQTDFAGARRPHLDVLSSD